MGIITELKLKPEVLSVINAGHHRIALAGIMKVGEQTIRNYIADNDVKLTQVAPLTYIKGVMGSLDFSDLIN